ncbi:MAG TPA: tetraacyldisaccharide 4'-kinase [Alphaproteobacteria bacterium]|jgi:tetraacyldisaccharide 4'-kinase
MRPPDFWSSRRVFSTLLVPAGCLYALATRLRLRRVGWRAPVPVVCVGNISVGGAGKTPVALALARMLQAAGRNPHFLTRGYGGREAGPLRVDPARHDARAVGDEPLLLARVAPTWVARDRAAGARAAAAAGAGCIVMDDGFQNPAVVKDLSLVVVDGGFGFGNERVIPAGPLREPIAAGLARADAIVLVGEDTAGASRHFAAKPVLAARVVPDEAAARFAGKDVVAFCGIGRPEKFFATLRALGANIVEEMPYRDHHAFRDEEIMFILEVAAKRGAAAVTTEKDIVRLSSDARLMVEALPVRIEFAEPAKVEALLATLFPSPAKAGDG